MRRGDAEERAEGGVSGAASVEAEDELVEVGLEVFATQAVIDAERPALEIGEDAVGPGQHDMGGHAADNMRIVRDAGSTGIPGPAVGLGEALVQRAIGGGPAAAGPLRSRACRLNTMPLAVTASRRPAIGSRIGRPTKLA